MTDLREDLDRAVRSVTIGEAPVQRAMREGSRLRTRRRLAVLGGALAIAAAAVASPSLARLGAGPAVPVTVGTATPVPSHTVTVHGDPVVTDGPAAQGAAFGLVAQGLVGGDRWSVAFSGKDGHQADTCYSAYLRSSGHESTVTLACASSADILAGYTAPDPAGVSGGTGTAVGGSTTYAAMIGAVGPDVTYLVLTFTDGQQLKLIPVTWQGHRYIAWLAPASMTIAGLTAHLGGPHADGGQTATAVPYDPAGGVPVFGLWRRAGQAAPPRADGVIGHGTAGGKAWSASAHEGPWGTCFLPGQDGSYCMQATRLAATAVFGGWGGSTPGPAFGSAAPGVAALRVDLSNGTSVQVRPVTVGNERLFAFWIGKGVAPTGWTAYDAAGRVAGTGSMTSGTATGSVKSH